MAAADFQDRFAAQVGLSRGGVVELDREPGGLVGGLEGDGHRGVFLVAEVEEQGVVGQPPGNGGVHVFLPRVIE